MPTIFLHDKTCFVCSVRDKYPETQSSGLFNGACDLDTRPSSIQRSAVYMYLQRCSKCGYCAGDLSTGDNRYGEIVRSSPYQQLLITNNYTETAVNFLLWAYLQEKTDQIIPAGWAYVHAAWVCDDNGLREKAIGCRRSALGLFNQARLTALSPSGHGGTDSVLLVDLMRRTGEFDQAQRLVEIELELEHEPQTMAQLEYEADLIMHRDNKCHPAADALEYMDNG